jgi:hypothetical protein
LAALTVTEPLPEPLAPAVTVIQAALLIAVQLHPVGAVTVTIVGPPLDVTACDAGAIVSVQATPAWLTVKVLPAIVSVPVRGFAVVLAAVVKDAVPLPDPVAPAVTVIHAALLTVVQLHPVGAVTFTLLDPPPAVTDCDVGEIVSLQAAAAWVTVKVLPAIVSVPDRELALLFSAVVNVAVPLPVPEAPEFNVIQPTLLVLVHAQPVAAVTVADPLPPPAPIDCEFGEIVGEQAAPASVSVKVLVPTVIVALRDVVDPLAAAL